MATVATSNFTEHRHGNMSQYEADRDDISTTLTVQTGYSTESRNSTLPKLRHNTFRLKGASSFPNLLSLYEEPIREEEGPDRVKKTKTSKRNKRKKETHKHDAEDIHENRAQLEMRHIRVDTVAKEQLDKFDQYVNRMKEKVNKQREDRKRYNEILQERFKEQEEAERKKLRLHRGPKHVYVHDRKYLKTLPVSNYCKATRLADDLQRKGVLRTRADVEKYWSGYADSHRRGEDIFSDSSVTSVNYPLQWMGSRKPEIKISDETDDETNTLTEAAAMTQTQLPPIRIKRKTKL